MSAKTGGELIADYLIEQGVPYVCGIPGHGDMGIFDAFKDRADRITVLQARHEQSAGHIADAYYRACGRPLATLTSIGPGSANLTMALATAYVDSQAVIAITGGVQSYMDGTGVLQELERQHDATSRASCARSSSAASRCTASTSSRARCTARSTSRSTGARARCTSTCRSTCRRSPAKVTASTWGATARRTRRRTPTRRGSSRSRPRSSARRAR